MDEPEAAYRLQRQLSFLVILHDLVRGNDNIQVHHRHSFTDFCWAYPGAQILSFDEGKVHQIEYRAASLFQWSVDLSLLLSANIMHYFRPAFSEE